MEYVSFNTQKIPALGFGTWQLRDREAAKAVETALKIGYRHIDTAQVYENESDVGDGIKAADVARNDVFLTTKVWTEYVTQGAMQRSVDASLKRLKTDYVDLLLIHWPAIDVPFQEQLTALQDIQKSGKAKLIGISNFTVAQMKEVIETIGAQVATNQVEYHPFLNQTPVLNYIRAHGMFLTAYSPLARGKISDNDIIRDIAKKHGKTPGQVSLRWLIQQGQIAAIPKAGSEKHIRENFEIFDFKLTDAEMKNISSLATPDGRIVNPAWSPKWDKAA